MGGPAIDPETGEFMQPGPCPFDEYEQRRICPPTTEVDCIVAEKVFDQCFKEDVIERVFPIPTGPGEDCENVDLTLVDRVDCTIESAECVVWDVSDPIDDNIRIVTVRQDIKMEIALVDEDPVPDQVLCTFTVTVEHYSTAQLFVPDPGLVFGPAGGPLVSCEVVGSTCFGFQQTFPDINSVIITAKICKIIEVTALKKLMIPNYGFCVPRPCVPAPQQIEIECPPIEELFPRQMEVEDDNLG